MPFLEATPRHLRAKRILLPSQPGGFEMKNYLDWADRIPKIRKAMDEIVTPYLDRKQIAVLFGVSPEGARRLLGSMKPMLHGSGSRS
jgi:hypothetical protein